jgi:acyl-CoA thioesterase
MAEGRDPEKLRQKLHQFAAKWPYFNLIGFEVVELEPGRSKTRVTFRSDLTNPDGVMHGGVIATLIDAGITQAMLMTDEYAQVRDTRGSMSTVDLGVKYVRAVRGGAITCESEIVHRGRRVVHARAVVRDERGKEIALGTATMLITLGDAKPG